MGSDTVSAPPARIKRPGIKVENGGLSLSWRAVITAVAVIIGGGGGLGAFTFASEQYVDEHIQEQAEAADAKQADRDDHLDAVLDRHEDAIEKHGRVIGEVKIDVNAIQKIQHQQYARDEARRVTAGIRARALREQTYDRIVDLNLARLRNDKPPCANLRCD